MRKMASISRIGMRHVLGYIEWGQGAYGISSYVAFSKNLIITWFPLFNIYVFLSVLLKWEIGASWWEALVQMLRHRDGQSKNKTFKKIRQIICSFCNSHSVECRVVGMGYKCGIAGSTCNYLRKCKIKKERNLWLEGS